MSCFSSNAAAPALEVRAPAPSFLSSLTWRRAVKGFGTEGPAPDVAPILKAILMAPSSFGIQPYKVHVVTDAAKKTALQGVCYGQAQVGQASHVLVFAAAKDAVAQGERYIATTQLDKHNAGCESGHSADPALRCLLAQPQPANPLLTLTPCRAPPPPQTHP
jgi:nitroreductase